MENIFPYGGKQIIVACQTHPALQLKSWNYGQFSMSITRFWINPVLWAVAYRIFSNRSPRGYGGGLGGFYFSSREAPNFGN